MDTTISVVIVLLTGHYSLLGTTGEDNLPPKVFLTEFARLNSLRAIIFHSEIISGCKSALAKYTTSSRALPGALPKALPKALPMPKTESMAFSVIGTGHKAKYVEHFDRLELHAVLTSASLCPRSSRGHNNLTSEKAIVKAAFKERLRTDKDTWLIDVTPLNRDEKAIQGFFKDVMLDIDDDVFAFHVNNNSNNNNNNIDIYEVYKIDPESDLVIVKSHGKWSKSGGFEVDPENKWKRRSDFRGHHFRIATLVAPPYTTVMEKLGNGDYRLEGMFVEIFRALRDKLNFTFSVHPPEDGEWGVLKGDGTWTGMVGQLATGAIDIAPTDFTVTIERSSAISFGQTITQIYSSLFIKNPTGNFNYLAYIQPLHVRAWLAVLGLIAAAPLVLALINRVSKSWERHHEEFVLSKAYVLVGSVLTFRGWSVEPTSQTTRMAFVTLLIGGAFIYWHWEAMLISYLASRIVVLPFTSLAGLVEDSGYNIMVTKGTSFSDAFRLSKDDLFIRAWNERIQPHSDSYPRQPSKQMIESIVTNSKFSTFAAYDNFFSIITFPEYINCELIAIPDKFDFKPYAYGFQKDSPFLGAFDYYIREMNEKGSMRQILAKYEPGAQICPDYSGKALGFDNCFTAFGALLAGMALALVLYALEMCSSSGLDSRANPNKFHPLKWISTYGVPKQLNDATDNKGKLAWTASMEGKSGAQDYLISHQEKVIQEKEQIIAGLRKRISILERKYQY